MLLYLLDINRYLEKIDIYKTIIARLEEKKLKKLNKFEPMLTKFNGMQDHMIKLDNKVCILPDELQHFNCLLINWLLENLN